VHVDIFAASLPCSNLENERSDRITIRAGLPFMAVDTISSNGPLVSDITMSSSAAYCR